MAITDNLRMMVKVCRLYYEENLSQKEISALMGISRPQDRKSTRLNSSHSGESRMPSSA